MKRYFRFFVIFLAFSCWIPHTASAQVVRVPDANLAALVRNALDLTANTPITRQAMQRLTFLDAQSYRIRQITGRGGQIKDITGLEHATQLTRLWLNNNQISDVRPLSGLTQLEALNIWNNQISDVRPLSGLTQLEALYLSDNPISNFQPLAGLTQLRHLGISVRRINDLHRHVDLTRLESLALQGSGNQISDLDFLTNLTQLTNLDVKNAQIRDLRFLRGLSQLKRLGLRRNQISDLKPLTNLTQLRSLGLGSNQISDLKPLASLTQLRYLYLWDNQIRNVTPLAGLINLEALYLDGNPIQDTSPVASLPNLRHKDFHIPPTLSIQDENPSEIPRVGNTLTYRVQIRNAQNVTGFNLAYSTPHKLTSVQSVGFFSGTEHNPGKTLRTGTLKASRLNTGQSIHNVGIFTLNATSAGTGELRVVGKLTTTQRIFNVDTRFPLTIFPSDAPVSTEVVPTIDLTPRPVGAGIVPDPNLAAAVRKALGLGPSAPITKQKMRKLTELRAKNSQITDLTGLEHATQLRTLSLADNQISDLTPLAKLTQLKGISLFRNQIKNLTPLAKLTQLTWLDLGGNQIRNIAPLASLTYLDWLSLWGNQIKILRPLVNLTRLSKLDLWNNQISNVTPLAKLTQLKELGLQDNQISDVTPVVKLVNLEALHLDGNPIQDFSPLASLTKLREVDIKISKPSPGSAGVIPDANLAAAVRKALGLGPKARITKQVMRKLTELRAKNSQIADLTGLEQATQLTRLDLQENKISDLSPLTGLKQLRRLDLWMNQIRDISPLTGLTNLTGLFLSTNQISDLTPLAGLTQLRGLDLSKNQIQTISPLAGLTKLETLNLGDNQISDIRRLTRLTQLKQLLLHENQIQTISPLAILTKLETLVLRSNQIQDVHPLAALTQLEALELQANQIQDVSPLAKLINLKKLRIGENPIQDTSPLASLTKLSEVDIEITQPSVPDGTPVVAATDAVVSISPSSVVSPAIGEQLILNLNIAGGESVAGYQVILQFDPTAFRYVESSNGDYLPTSAFFVPPVVNRGSIELASTALTGVSNGGGTLATVTFEVLTVKTSTLTLSEPLLADSQGNTFQPQVEAGEVTEPPKLKGDVTGDGIVNIQDLVLVASSFGQTGEISADVNGDGVVNIADLVLVAGALRNTAAAPILHPQLSETLTAADVHQWLSQTQLLDLRDATTQRGVRYLAQLLRVLTPKETVLLPNYPNPFNPETWIPYQLAKPADVTLTIYAGTGEVVRRLVLGHQAAGLYQSRSRAAYWDGRNALGEPVASGIYFYTLTVGDFTATRKMLILK